MRTLLVAVPLLGLLAAAIWLAVTGWNSVEVSSIPVWGYAAMVLGVAVAIAVGVGLMMLVFYSNRHGYDEAAGGDWHDEPPQ